MKKLAVSVISKIAKDQFFSSAFWVFLGAGFLNVGNYLYHLLMGRMLGVSLYGALESMISALYVLAVPTSTLALVVVKYVSVHKGRGEKEEINNLYGYMLDLILIYGLIVLALISVFSPLIQSFLHLPSLLLALLLPISFYINLFYFLNKSILQGISSFFKFSVLSFIEAFVKVAFSVVLVYLGFKAEGAYAAIVISLILGAFFSFLFVKDIVKIKPGKAKYNQAKDLLKFSFPTFITTIALTSIFTTDVILVRHFFPGVESGYYSALSVLGKIIYFASSPIILVLFPMVSEHHSRGESYWRLIGIGTLFTLAISVLITAIYFVAPKFMVSLLFGEEYLATAGLLGIFGIFISLLSLCGLLANFYLSIHMNFPSFLVFIAAILQIILIYAFHATLAQVIWVSIAVSFALLISLLLCYPYAKRVK